MAITLTGLPTIVHNNTASVDYIGTYPTGILSGEYIYAHVQPRGRSEIVTPAGWHFVNRLDNLPPQQEYLYIRKASGTETGDVIWTSDTSLVNTVVMQRLAGVYADGLVGDAVSGISTEILSTVSDTLGVFPSMDTLHPECIVICTGSNGGAASVSGWTNGFTEFYDSNQPNTTTQTGIARTVYGAYKIVPLASITGETNNTNTNSVIDMTLTMALKPSFYTARQHPDAVIEQTGLTGVLANVQDDPDAPDANWWVS